MILYALALFPATIPAMQAQEWKAFQPYRICMLKQAKRLARLHDEPGKLEDTAKPKCRRQYAAIVAEVALDSAGIAIDSTDPASNFNGYDPQSYLRAMEAKLSDEFAAAVAQKRGSAK